MLEKGPSSSECTLQCPHGLAIMVPGFFPHGLGSTPSVRMFDLGLAAVANTQEAEVEGSLRVLHQPDLHRERLSQKTKKQNKTTAKPLKQ